jgi:peroxiredoxin
LEFPHLQKNYEQFNKQGLEIVSINVSMRDTPEAIKKFWQDTKLTFKVVKDEQGAGSISKAYKVRGCPTNYLVGKDGKIISRWVGFRPQTGAEHLKEEFAKAGFKQTE